MDFGPPLGEVFLHSPEDLIIYKLWYFSLSQQTKHLQDVAAILSEHLVINWITVILSCGPRRRG